LHILCGKLLIPRVGWSREAGLFGLVAVQAMV
jgi:hypothetical protein